MRLRFSNALGTRPVTFDGVHVGLQRTAAALVPGSNQPISFAGKERDYGRDVLSLSGIAAVVWLEGINDFSKNGHAPVEAVEAGMKDVVGRILAKFAGVRIIGATLTSALGSTNANHGSPEEDAKRRRSTSSFATAVWSTGLPISMPRRSIRRPAACAPNSSPKARLADLATRSIRTASATWRWARRLT